MNDWSIAIRSFWFHRRVNLAVMLGVAAATAVLGGALIIGDSMRGSLRSVTLDRLGKVDVIIRGQGFFREALAGEVESQPGFADSFSTAVPVMLIPDSTAEFNSGESTTRAADINVFGVNEDFWKLGSDQLERSSPIGDDEIVINQVMADDLQIDRAAVDSGNASITIGIPKSKLIPSDSALGEKKDLVERIVNLKVIDIIPATSLGRFGLHVSQLPPRNAYLSIKTVQQTLAASGVFRDREDWQQANAILLAGAEGKPIPGDDEITELKKNFSPKLVDLGLRLKRVTRKFNDETVFDYFSLSSDRMVIDDTTRDLIRAQAYPNAVELFTYLANEINSTDENAPPGIPYSMVTAVHFDSRFQLRSISGDWIKPLSPGEIVLNRWAAEDLGLNVGDTIRLSYFEPESTHGQENEKSTSFRIADIAELTKPIEPYQFTRRELVDAVFDKKPTLANDPDMTPEVAGLTDAASIENWDVPFTMTREILGEDNDYWDYYRTTSKAYVSMETGQQLWHSRFGTTTSFRISAEHSADEIEQRLIKTFFDSDHLVGLQIVPIKANGLKASSGATPFDALFLGLSMFVIGAALILVSLLFRLGLQQRAGELGTLLAFGFRQKHVGKIWRMEMLIVCLCGALLGTLIGVGYAQLMIAALTTWLFTDIGAPFLEMHIKWWTLPLGMICGVIVCLVTIQLSIRGARKKSVRSLLSGIIESTGKTDIKTRRWVRYAILICVITGAAIGIYGAINLAGESQGGAFMTFGFLILGGSLLAIWQWLARQTAGQGDASISLESLAWTNSARSPLRSTLTIGMVAVASFLIVAISAFRLAPSERGTAGFDYVATTSQPIFADLNSAAGQSQVLRGELEQFNSTSRVFSFRYKSGEDASCNNPYQSTKPQVLGVPDDFIDYFNDPANERFAFAMTESFKPKIHPPDADNPWLLLGKFSSKEPIPVIIDKNTAWYNLKVYFPGTDFTVEFDSGETVKFRLVGLLDNTVLQGSLLIAERDFRGAFPDISGDRFFMIKSSQNELDALSDSLADQGFDSRTTESLLAGFLAVQNTYLATFQSLGALGLLLGTFGLAAVQLRSVLERRRELGLMRAVGYSRNRLAKMVLLENAFLLVLGLLVGIGSALFTTLPHFVFGDATVPWAAFAIMFAVIALVGLLTGWLASLSIYRAPLIESIRAS